MLIIIVGAVYIAHQDFWFWRSAHPLVFGFLPVGLFYHACYTLLTALVMLLLVKQAWPSELEAAEEERRGEEETRRRGDRQVSLSPTRSVASAGEDGLK